MTNLSAGLINVVMPKDTFANRDRGELEMIASRLERAAMNLRAAASAMGTSSVDTIRVARATTFEISLKGMESFAEAVWAGYHAAMKADKKLSDATNGKGLTPPETDVKRTRRAKSK